MPNQYVDTFYDAFCKFYSARQAFCKTLKKYIKSQHQSENFSDKERKDLETLTSIYRAIETFEDDIGLANFIKKEVNPDQLSNEILDLIVMFHKTLKHGVPKLCRVCKSKNVLKRNRCTLCGMMACQEHFKIYNTNALKNTLNIDLLKGRLHENNSYICSKCFEFINLGIPIIEKFETKLLPHYKYFVLGQRHTSPYYGAASFLHDFIFYTKNENFVVFKELYVGDDDAPNYTDRNKAQYFFEKKLQQLDYSGLGGYKKIANVMSPYISNRFAFKSASDREEQLIIYLCNKKKIPIYTFDNKESSLGRRKQALRNLRIKSNKKFAERIAKEMKELPPQTKAFILIGKDHIGGSEFYDKYALQKFLKAFGQTIGINCFAGNYVNFRLRKRGKLPSSGNTNNISICWPNCSANVLFEQ
ncbi:hypothetical protein P0136_03080 [Lentisphaerota bacterium ZTH]|nr:hypothetical protein JYG24_05780 [Lentisphaerota bacterium]WET06986.1 hypothetical protein P0136_03080 [Lentisphaerota bacterium ZTH]